MRTIEDRTRLILLAIVTLAFCWILRPFYGAILWALVFAIVFTPVYRLFARRLRGSCNLAALLTTAAVVFTIVIPLSLVSIAITRELSTLYALSQANTFNLARTFERLIEGLPSWLMSLLGQLGLASLKEVQEAISATLLRGSQLLTTQAMQIGQNTFNFFVNFFAMIYLLFFLLRDRDQLPRQIIRAIPLRSDDLHNLFRVFATVIRATVKGDMLVAVLQGSLGGAIFWLLGIEAPLLWAAVMAFASLLPTIGAGLIWMPVAIYLLASGDVWRAMILVSYGILVIGLVDNFLRPILVGNDTRMPDYIVLISTLGGIEAFGLNGFIVGPVIAAMFIAVWDMFAKSRQDKQINWEI